MEKEQVKTILPMIIPLLIAMVLICIPQISDFLFKFEHGGILYVYFFLLIAIVSQSISNRIRFKK